ncbi:hypothetical protein [Salinispora arenicola]|uniref:hypothetical protein n=1 Tax=Salinispora arenicola TaxID=168697 RepID=UPI0003A8E6E8|nr:hypothetical protein [Salinispora arenicola]
MMIANDGREEFLADGIPGGDALPPAPAPTPGRHRVLARRRVEHTGRPGRVRG